MPDPESAIRLLLVDDHEVVRAGLAALFERRPQFTVVAQAGSCAEAIAQARRFVPDVILMDLRLPDGSGIVAARVIRDEFPAIAVVFLTSSPEQADVYSAVLAGARGYVLKQTPTAELVRTLEIVGRGGSLLDPAVTGPILDRIRRVAAGVDDGERLTAREREILRLLADGSSNSEIAAALFLSPKTIKNYVSSILTKLGLDRRTQVSRFIEGNEDLLR